METDGDWHHGGVADQRYGEVSLLLVEVAGLRCGVPADDVVELHPVVETVALPGAPLHIDGAINVRGSVVAVIDVRRRLGLPTREPMLSDHLVVSRVGERKAALRVDRALELTAVSNHAIDGIEGLAEVPHVGGIGRLADGLVVIHDLATFLSADEGAAVDHALERLAAETPNQ